jgi:predicted ATP-grasp superfamily ATP-dependent carboligase
MVEDEYPHGQLAVVRTLARLGVRVHPVHERRRTAGALSRYADPVILPFADPPAQDMLEQLIGLGDELARPVLLPTDDIAALFVAEHSEALGGSFRVARSPAGLAGRLANKAELYSLCVEHGVPAPRSSSVSSRDEVEEFASRAELPIMMKVADPRLVRRRAGVRSVALAASVSELLGSYERASRGGAPNVVLQEYIPGGPDAAWILGACFLASGDSAAVGTARKLRDYPPGRGVTTYAVTEPNAVLEGAAVTFFRALGYQGIVDTCWRWDERDGAFKLLDANPRVGANFRALAMGGLDVARAHYLDMTGQVVPSPEFVGGRSFIVEPFDAEAIRAAPTGRPRWGAWLQQVVAADERAWWCADDPLPAIAIALLTARKAAARAVKSRHPGPPA